jgi:peptide/nickel transport system substrate-binding protein
MGMYRISRREFLAQLGLVTAGSVLASCAAPTGPETGGAVPAAGAGAQPAAGGEVAPGVARADTLILENPTGRVVPADDFNRWRPGIQSASTGLQQLGLDALWYIDPDAGIDGVWDNSLAAEKPIYNEDFTQMTVKLREGIYWSDGVEFTADDLIYTVDIQNTSKAWRSPTTTRSFST